MEVVSTITESTLVPIGLVIVFIGGVVWLTRLHSSNSSNTATLEVVLRRLDAVERENGQMIERMARIETKLDFLVEQAKLSHP